MSEEGLRKANKRGGKKVQKKRKLWEQVESGQHTPQTKTEVRPIHLEFAAFSGASSSSGVSGPTVDTSVLFSKHSENRVYINDPASGLPPPLPNPLVVGESPSGCSSSDPLFALASHSPRVATPVGVVCSSVENPKPTSDIPFSGEKCPSPGVSKGSNSPEGKSLALPVPIPKVVSAVIGGGKQEAWLSLDFNGVCNIPESGDVESDGIHQYNIPILLNFINTVCSERGFRLGITSYIGIRGQLSQSRRRELTKSVREFNKAVNPGLRLGLKIVSDKAEKAPFLNEAQAALHIDDRLDLCDQISKTNSKIKTVLVTKPSRKRHHSTHWVFSSLRDSLEAVSNGTIRVNCQLHSRAFDEFWPIPI